MSGIIKYFSWNALLLTALIGGTLLDNGIIVTIMTIYFICEAVIYSVVTLIEKSRFHLYETQPNVFKVYKVFFEPVYIVVAILLGHIFISMCMAIVYFAYIYMLADKAEFDKKNGVKV